MPKLIELTSRNIPGNGGTVTLMASLKDDCPHEVIVIGPDGEPHTIFATTRSAAVDAYWHPFADITVPDVFSRELGSKD